MKKQSILELVIVFTRFYAWWDKVGSAIPQKEGEDTETYVQRVAKEAYILGRDSAA